MKKITIYTDGACSGNPGPGGWGAVLLYKDRVKEISGAEPKTTNQRMELQAVIEALKALKIRDWDVTVYSDSAYFVNAVEQNWLGRWQSNGWKNSKKEAVANRDLWEELLELMQINKVKVMKVKGHAGDKYNEICDRLAREAIKSLDN